MDRWAATRVPAGLIVAGTAPVACDCVAAMSMGFEVAEIRTLANADAASPYRLGSSELSDVEIFDEVSERDLNLGFAPATGWKGSIERGTTAEARAGATLSPAPQID